MGRVCCIWNNHGVEFREEVFQRYRIHRERLAHQGPQGGPVDHRVDWPFFDTRQIVFDELGCKL